MDVIESSHSLLDHRLPYWQMAVHDAPDFCSDDDVVNNSRVPQGSVLAPFTFTHVPSTHGFCRSSTSSVQFNQK